MLREREFRRWNRRRFFRDRRALRAVSPDPRALARTTPARPVWPWERFPTAKRRTDCSSPRSRSSTGSAPTTFAPSGRYLKIFLPGLPDEGVQAGSLPAALPYNVRSFASITLNFYCCFRSPAVQSLRCTPRRRHPRCASPCHGSDRRGRASTTSACLAAAEGGTTSTRVFRKRSSRDATPSSRLLLQIFDLGLHNRSLTASR